jgi:hypothetical protein
MNAQFPHPPSIVLVLRSLCDCLSFPALVMFVTFDLYHDLFASIVDILQSQEIPGIWGTVEIFGSDNKYRKFIPWINLDKLNSGDGS